MYIFKIMIVVIFAKAPTASAQLWLEKWLWISKCFCDVNHKRSYLDKDIPSLSFFLSQQKLILKTATAGNAKTARNCI